jgi:hypothetical protein
MPDYECPACGGGFPASAGITADACPWCGELMDGDDGDDPPGVVTPQPLAGASSRPLADEGNRLSIERPSVDPEDILGRTMRPSPRRGRSHHSVGGDDS